MTYFQILIEFFKDYIENDFYGYFVVCFIVKTNISATYMTIRKQTIRFAIYFGYKSLKFIAFYQNLIIK